MMLLSDAVRDKNISALKMYLLHRLKVTWSLLFFPKVMGDEYIQNIARGKIHNDD